MAEETLSEDVYSEDETTEESQQEQQEQQFDKVRQQVQQEIGNKLRSLESLPDTVNALAAQVEALASNATKTSDVKEAESIITALDELDDDDVPDAKSVKTAIGSLVKRIDELSKKAALPDEDVQTLRQLKEERSGRQAWATDKSSFVKSWPDISGQYDDLTDTAIAIIDADEELDLTDLKGIRHRLASDLASDGGRPARTRKSTAGTRITKSGASSTAGVAKAGDGIDRDANGLPIGLWNED